MSSQSQLIRIFISDASLTRTRGVQAYQIRIQSQKSCIHASHVCVYGIYFHVCECSIYAEIITSRKSDLIDAWPVMRLYKETRKKK